ncbi:MAG: hypothetical protein LAN63_12740 [Acidobacteriia bacterium]|nr:hypothetical protein [Terriglobia bacterium]
MVQRGVGRDASRPGANRPSWVEPGARPVHAPEGFDRQVFGLTRIADDAHDPPIDLALELAKQRLEGFDVALRESLE